MRQPRNSEASIINLYDDSIPSSHDIRLAVLPEHIFLE